MENFEKCPLVSIIVPIYNHERFVPDFLESVFDQEYTNLEIIMCDDGSTDNSFTLARSYEERLREYCKRVVIIKNEFNQGVTKTLNTLLDLAEGEYIKFIASDDILATGAIKRYVDYLVNNKECDFLVANAAIFDEELGRDELLQNLDSCELFYTEANRPDYSGDWLKTLFKGYNCCSPTLIYSRRLIERVGKYDEDCYIEDYDFALRVAEAGYRPYYLNEVQVYYRISSNSISHSVSEEKKIRMLNGEIATLVKHRNAVELSFFELIIKDKVYSTMDLLGQNNYGLVKKYLIESIDKYKLKISKIQLRLIWYVGRAKKIVKTVIRYNNGRKYEK